MAIACQVRQGDVLLHPIDAIPKQAKLLQTEGPLVLAHGELTGHAHRIDSTGRLTAYRHNGKVYLDVVEPVELVHEEHAALVLVPGAYVVRRQVEQWLDEVRWVAD